MRLSRNDVTQNTFLQMAFWKHTGDNLHSCELFGNQIKTRHGFHFKHFLLSPILLTSRQKPLPSTPSDLTFLKKPHKKFDFLSAKFLSIFRAPQGLFSTDVTNNTLHLAKRERFPLDLLSSSQQNSERKISNSLMLSKIKELKYMSESPTFLAGKFKRLYYIWTNIFMIKPTKVVFLVY